MQYLFSACLLLVCVIAQAAETNTVGVYQQRAANREGIGKFYMGREISHVMGHMGADWLERPERERQERTDLLISQLPVKEDSVVADIGAGTGLFSFAIAARAPAGKVLAVDIQPEMLAIISAKMRANGVTNVEPVRGTVSNPNLPDNALDLIFIVDAYHEFSHPREMGQAMFAALKPGGRIVLVEYRAEDASVPILRLHKMSEAQAKLEMSALGLRWVETGSFLPQQHFLLFIKP
ncbi:MAG: FkbM family methyltransferase [Gammaproteobacteria bacterium]|jgi:FkbM family methyltransferase